MERTGRYLRTAVYWAALMTASVGSLCAQEVEKKDEEPIWVISWAVFFLLIALTVVLLGRSTKRRDTLLNEEELKQYEEQLGEKRAERDKEPEDTIDDEDDD